MMRRRVFLSFLISISSRPLLAQQPRPKLFVLPKGTTAPILSAAVVRPKRERSLQGWLVCNGAEADRLAYRELFSAIGEKFGSGDGQRSFNLPSDSLELRNGEPVRGLAICPDSTRGLAGELSAFDLESNL